MKYVYRVKPAVVASCLHSIQMHCILNIFKSFLLPTFLEYLYVKSKQFQKTFLRKWTEITGNRLNPEDLTLYAALPSFSVYIEYICLLKLILQNNNFSMSFKCLHIKINFKIKAKSYGFDHLKHLLRVTLMDIIYTVHH